MPRKPKSAKGRERLGQTPTPMPLGLCRTPYKPFSGVGVGNPTRKAQKAGLNPPRTAQNGLQAVFRGWGRQPYVPIGSKGSEGRITNPRRRRVSRRSVTGCNACRGNMQKNLVGWVSASPEHGKTRRKRGAQKIKIMTKVAEN